MRDGKIVTMTPAGHHAAPEGSQIVDARGLILMPSMVDAHVHLREPGFEYKEDINTGLEAAARGGFGSVMCMANTKPVNDNALPGLAGAHRPQPLSGPLEAEPHRQTGRGRHGGAVGGAG